LSEQETGLQEFMAVHCLNGAFGLHTGYTKVWHKLRRRHRLHYRCCSQRHTSLPYLVVARIWGQVDYLFMWLPGNLFGTLLAEERFAP